MFQVAVRGDQTRGREAFGCVPASTLHPSFASIVRCSGFSTLCFDQPHDNDEVAHAADGFSSSNNGSTAEAAVIRHFFFTLPLFFYPGLRGDLVRKTTRFLTTLLADDLIRRRDGF